jgi:ubiquinone/menaquinone biosynthesis C-methylase UbiE
MSESESRHNSIIVEQFTRQAAPFARMHTAEESMELFKQVAGVTRDDIALDVACGPGLVACAFATAAKRVTGVDITPAMLEQARQLQQREGLTNVDWELAEGTKLPFADESFSLVLSRYAFHHFPQPKATLAEMARVCQPGGRVCVADVYVTSEEQDEAYNRIERLRDPSHVRALRLDEYKTMFVDAGLSVKEQAFYRFDVAVDRLLEATRTPEPEAKDFREEVEADISRNVLGVNARYDDAGVLQFSFPILITCGRSRGY